MIGDSTLLDISVFPQRPEADDWAFVFAGRNTLTSLRGQPGVPWRLEEADALWHLNKELAVPIGYWEGKATWAFSILTLKFTRYICAQVLIPYCVFHTFAYTPTLDFE